MKMLYTAYLIVCAILIIVSAISVTLRVRNIYISSKLQRRNEEKAVNPKEEAKDSPTESHRNDNVLTARENGKYFKGGSDNAVSGEEGIKYIEGNM